MPKTTIDDVREAGYTVALASGSVDAEERALGEAREAASPDIVHAEAGEIAREIASLAVSAGRRGDELDEIVRTATSRALEQIQSARDERVEFHERALAVAKETPDVFFVSALGDPSTPDDDVRIYIACKADGSGWDEGAQEMLDALVESGLPSA